MVSRDAITDLPTHQVTNQPPALGDYQAFDTDRALQEAVTREGAPWISEYLRELGALTGSEYVMEQGFQANRAPPELAAFDRYGQRIDEVRYHPAYHELMRLAIHHDVHSIAWTRQGEGGQVAHVAALYLLTQPEQGICCPITMTHAAVPALRLEPRVAELWEPKIRARAYDPRCLPAADKAGVTFGMAMTEKQGGSDVRANTTHAQALGGDEYELIGHKWFCSAPMSDAFLTLAQTPAGLSCFLVPRWRSDGRRNPFCIQRLKDKLGDRSNASAEIEYDHTWARRVGEEGHGVRTIIEMVQQTRLDSAAAPVGMMRQALVQAFHHVRHRSAFGKPLIDQPLMRNLLADMALEIEAGVALILRIARSFDYSETDHQERLLGRVGTAMTKYWTNKRAPQVIYEAMECLGGNGYVEESSLPRLYRQVPVNSIWEGSGNVICLDVLRAMEREPQTVPALLEEVEAGRGGHQRLDAAIDRLKQELGNRAQAESRARRVTELMALTLQASLLVRHAPAVVADAFCESRLGDSAGLLYGTLAPEIGVDAILQRVWSGD